MNTTHTTKIKTQDLTAGQAIIVNGATYTVKSATRWSGRSYRCDLVLIAADGTLATLTTDAVKRWAVA